MLKSFILGRSLKLDIYLVIFLCIFSFATLNFFLENHGQIMIYFDSYLNFQKIVAWSEGSVFEKRTITTGPYFIFNSILLQLFSDHISPLILLRTLNLFFVIQLVVFIYLIARKIFDPIHSLMTAILALFMPVVIIYSGTLHSDIFSLAMGFTALFFSIKPKRLSSIILATIFISLTAARLDILLLFLIPYFIGLTFFLNKKFRVKSTILLAIFLVAFFVPAYFIMQTQGIFYKDEYFDHSLLNQIITLVNFNTISAIIQSSVEITGDKAVFIKANEGINIFYLSILLMGIIFFVVRYRKKIQKFLTNINSKLGEGETLVIYLVIMVLISLVSLAAFHTTITPLEGKIIDDNYLPRYMIGMRIILLFGFVYGLSVISSFYPWISRLIAKQDNSTLELDQTKVVDSQVFNYAHFKNKSSVITSFKPGMLASYAFLIVIMVLFVDSMWDSAVRFYENDAAQIAVYKDAAQWLSNNLGSNEKVFLPMANVFWSFEPSLKDRTFEYRSMWESLGHILRITTTEDQVLEVRENLKEFVHDDDNHVKYLVFSWNDLHAKIATGITHLELPKEEVCEMFDTTLMEVKRLSFRLPHSNWGNTLVICEVLKNSN